jgi:TetR/AcrR family transcriptional repressor of bet genes
MPGTKASQQQRREQIMRAAYAVAAAEGLERLTIRQVAATAGLSGGLVLFHFASRDDVVIELLEWLLEQTAALTISPALAQQPPLERLYALLRQEIRRFSEDPAQLRLLFEYWVMGLRHEAIQVRMRQDLHRYRDAFLPLAADLIAHYPAHFAGATASGLAATMVSFIKGCALQTMIDLDHTDSRELRQAADTILLSLARACRAVNSPTSPS